jgi:hypothetical protein
MDRYRDVGLIIGQTLDDGYVSRFDDQVGLGEGRRKHAGERQARTTYKEQERVKAVHGSPPEDYPVQIT